MKDYAVVPNTTGSFPSVAATNSATPTSIDGTPVIADVLDDVWGARQALMDYAGLTPSGFSETSGTSQNLNALKIGFGHPGEVVQFMGNADPSTYLSAGLRLLLLEGAGVLIANYPDLVAACYVGDIDNAAVELAGGGFYKASDAAGTTPDTAGPYFILPDTRGRVSRGLDTSGSIDPDGASRYIGDYQLDSLETHNHIVRSSGVSYYNTLALNYTTGPGAATIIDGTTVGNATAIASESNMGETMTGHNAGVVTPKGRVNTIETRARNFSTKFAIRF